MDIAEGNREAWRLLKALTAFLMVKPITSVVVTRTVTCGGAVSTLQKGLCLPLQISRGHLFLKYIKATHKG